MWLVDTSTLQLEYFSNAPYHTYAILSHTWEFEEVTFQDMQNGKAKDRLGYAKVLGTCAKAKSHGLRWVWMDTCCINKESSAELSEAINSMFTWYARSAVCYAVLSDVSKQQVWLDWADSDVETLTVVENDALAMLTYDETKWRSIASECRWFKRGWTLQELIAPSDLRFYNQTWSYMGAKKDLLITLWHATGIDPLALEDYQSLPKFTVARRMAWAAGRWTTRIEDRAYSLFGLFGVAMPLLYGEGERAFVRLQEELVRTSTDHSVFAWRPAADQIRRSRSRRDVRESLFARSPDDYRTARRIVRWHAENGHKTTQPFRLTNRGVDFDGVYVADTEGGKLVLLNCRFEDKPQGPIALRITEDKVGEGPENDCWVDYDHRLTVYDWRTRKDSQHRTRLTILRRPPEPPLDMSTTAAAAMFHIIPDAESEDIDIHNPSPDAMWNQSTGVMCPPFLDRTTARREVVGSATVRGRASGITFSLAFKSSRRVWARTLRLALSVHSQIEAQQLLEMQDGSQAQPVVDEEQATEYDDSSDNADNENFDRHSFHSLGYGGEDYEGEKYPGEDVDIKGDVNQSGILEEDLESRSHESSVPNVFASVPSRPGAFARLKDIKHVADNVYYIIEVSTGWTRS